MWLRFSCYFILPRLLVKQPQGPTRRRWVENDVSVSLPFRSPVRPKAIFAVFFLPHTEGLPSLFVPLSASLRPFQGPGVLLLIIC